MLIGTYLRRAKGSGAKTCGALKIIKSKGRELAYFVRGSVQVAAAATQSLQPNKDVAIFFGKPD